MIDVVEKEYKIDIWKKLITRTIDQFKNQQKQNLILCVPYENAEVERTNGTLKQEILIDIYNKDLT